MTLYINPPTGVSIQARGTVESSATAIPVFVGNFIIKNGKNNECLKIDNILELRKILSPARVRVSLARNAFSAETDDNEEGITPYPGQRLHSISTPNCVSGGYLMFRMGLQGHAAGYNTLKVKCKSNSSAKINVDFTNKWLAAKSNDQRQEITMQLENFENISVIKVNWVNLIIKTNPQSQGRINIEGNCLNTINSTGYIWSLHSNFSESYNAVEIYFQNGGGPCYILPLVNGSDAELAALPEVIRAQCPEATLLVCADTDAGLAQLAAPRTKQDIYQALNPLLQEHPAYFLLADSPDGTSIANVEPTQTAVYYPALLTSSYVHDDAIEVVGGYWNPAVRNLAQLKTQDFDSYELIRQSLSPLRDAPYCPPSSTIAAAYCRNDRERGVWKAPANISLIGVKGLAVHIGEKDRGALNDKGINIISWFTDKGAVICGARTLSDSVKWRYVSVRRLFNIVEKDIKSILQTMMFEANSSLTWERTHAAVHNYLSALWRKGALSGNTEAEAFFVKIGEGKTMQPEDVAAGKMILQVGMAAVRPAEFVILQFSQPTS
jgi:hypothetical protein